MVSHRPLVTGILKKEVLVGGQYNVIAVLIMRQCPLAPYVIHRSPKRVPLVLRPFLPGIGSARIGASRICIITRGI